MALDTARAVQDRGHRVFFATGMDNTGENSLWSELLDSDLSVRRLRWMRRPPGHWDLLALLELTHLLNRERPDCLHLHTSKAGTIGALAARAAGLGSVVYSSHGHLFNSSLELQDVTVTGVKGNLYRMLRRLTIGLVDRVVALSEQDRDEQIQLGLGRPEDFVVIPNGVDYERFRSVREQAVAKRVSDFSLDRFEPLLVNVGRLVREKSQETIIRAVRELRRRGYSAGVVFVGEGPYRDRLDDLAERLEVRPYVVFAGAQEEVQTFLKAGDVFCFSSLYESQGVAVMEAMASGTPVVSTRAGGLTELIKPGETALSVDVQAPDQLAGAVQRFVEDEDLRERIVRRARSRIRDGYTVDAVTERTLSLYEQVVAESS